MLLSLTGSEVLMRVGDDPTEYRAPIQGLSDRADMSMEVGYSFSGEIHQLVVNFKSRPLRKAKVYLIF